jgi:hypothetical protein
MPKLDAGAVGRHKKHHQEKFHMKKLLLGLVATLGLFAFVVPAQAQGEAGSEKPPEAKKEKKHKKSKKAKAKEGEGAEGGEGGEKK